ncbi:MAG: hypothetical protein WBW81_09625, partial [Methylocella sp.]
EPIDAGVAPRELARELGFGLPAGLVKYDPNEPRVPAGSGYGSGDWTSGDATPGPALTVGGNGAGIIAAWSRGGLPPQGAIEQMVSSQAS